MLLYRRSGRLQSRRKLGVRRWAIALKALQQREAEWVGQRAHRLRVGEHEVADRVHERFVALSTALERLVLRFDLSHLGTSGCVRENVYTSFVITQFYTSLYKPPRHIPGSDNYSVECRYLVPGNICGARPDPGDRTLEPARDPLYDLERSLQPRLHVRYRAVGCGRGTRAG